MSLPRFTSLEPSILFEGCALPASEPAAEPVAEPVAEPAGFDEPLYALPCVSVVPDVADPSLVPVLAGGLCDVSFGEF
jgi:hypothetical protein